MFNLKSKQNKKGLSDLVATTLTILIGITALFFIGASIKNVAIGLAPELSCAELQIQGEMKFGNVCYNTNSKEVEASVDIGFNNIGIVSLDFVIGSNEETNEYHCGLSCGGDCVIQDSGWKTYFFDAETSPNTITLSTEGCVLASANILPDCNN